MKTANVRHFKFFAINLFLVLSFLLGRATLAQDALTFGLPNKIGTIDPVASTNAQTKLLLPLVFEPIVIVNSKQELEPVLAESWTISPDQKKITIKIKTDHRFSDASPVTTEDILVSFQRLCSPESQASSELQGLEGCYQDKNKKPKPLMIKVLDATTVEFGININPTIFLYQLASSRVVIVKLQKQNGLLGSGPYRIQEKTDDFIKLLRNESYHAKDKLKNNGITLKYVDETNIQKTLDSTPLDGSIMYRLSAITKISHPDYKVIEDKPIITQTLVLNNQNYPFNLLRIRKALAAEIYNNSSVQKCVTPYQKAYGVIPIGLGGSIANQAPGTIEPPRGKVRLPKPVTVKIHQHVGRKSECESNAIVAAAEKLNIKIEFVYHDDYKTLWPLYLNHQLDGFIELFLFKNREAFSILQFFSNVGPENFANVRDKKLRQLMQDCLDAPSSAERFVRYRIMAHYLQDQAVVVPLYYVASSNLVNNCLGGITDDFYFNPFQRLPELFHLKNCKSSGNK